jgi:parallel beta-helix repeat protein
MVYAPTIWSDNDDITAAKLNNMEGQYNAAKTDFGAITVTMTVAVDGTSIHAIGADYLVPIGSTSAETYINAAIDAAVAAGGGEVLLLEGTYVIDDFIFVHDNITLSGMGANTIIKIKDGSGVMSAITNDDDVAPGNKNIVIKDLTVDGNKANQANTQFGININSCTDTSGRIIIRNCFVNHVRDVGIHAYNSKTVLIDKCALTDCGKTGVEALIKGNVSNVAVTNCTCSDGYNGIWLYGCTDSIISNCTCFSTTGSGIALTNSTTRTAVTGCTLYNATDGLYISGSTYNAISGNTFRDNSLYGVYILGSSHYTNVTGNSFYKNWTGIKAENTNYVLISGNTSAYNTTDGIKFIGCNRGEISSNVVYMNGAFGIYLNSSTRNVIAGNNVTASGQLVGGANIFLYNSASYNSITGNLCYKGGGPVYPNYGINIGGANCTSNLVTGNNLKEGGSAGTLADGGTTTDKTGWMVAGNKIA